MQNQQAIYVAATCSPMNKTSKQEHELTEEMATKKSYSYYHIKNKSKHVLF